MSLRLQGPNWFQTLQYSALNEVIPVGDLTRPKWLWGMLLEFKGRVTVAGGPTGATLAECPFSLLNYVRIEGQHKTLGQGQCVYLRGPSINAHVNQYGRGRAVSGFYPAALGPNIAGGLATGSYDFDLFYLIPFPPQGIPLSQQSLFMLKTDDWRTLQIHASFGDSSALFHNLGGSTVTFSAYGSAGGSPTLDINTIEPQLGSFRNSIQPALVWKTWQDVTTPMTASNLADGLLAELSIGKRYRGLTFKQGVLDPGRSAGVVVFASSGLYDPNPGLAVAFAGQSANGLTRPLVKLDQNLIRNPHNWLTEKEWTGFAEGVTQVPGYGLIEFCEGGDIRTVFPAHRLTSANKFELRGDVVVVANQQGELIEEQIEGNPVYLDKSGAQRTFFSE